MTHGRPPRRPRPMAINLVNVAATRATRLTQVELDQVINPLREAVAALRRGVATEFEWQIAVTAVNIGDAIEKQGVVRGLAEHLRSIDLALLEIGKRARSSGDWRSPALYYEERDLMDLLLDLHSHQVKSLSYGEFIRARDRAIAQTASTPGGRIVERTPRQEDMLQEAS